MWESVEVTDPTSALPPVCVLGLGLIGGSLLRVLHDAGHDAFGYNRSTQTAQDAVGDGYSASSDLDETLRRAADVDALVVLATPVTTIEPLVARVAELAPTALLTDVISVKQEVTEIVRRVHPGGRYVGGHPMAGTSRSGWAATDPTLFGGAMWMVTTEDTTPADDWLTVATMALAAGASVVPAAPDAHDRAVVRIRCRGNHRRARRQGHRGDGQPVVGRRGVLGGDHPHRAAEQRGIGGRPPRPAGARHRVPTDVASTGVHPAHDLGDLLFHTDHVGQQRGRGQLGDPCHQRFDCGHRRRQHHQRVDVGRPAQRLVEVRRRRIPVADRVLRGLGRPVVPEGVVPGVVQHPQQRPADQAEAEHTHRWKSGGRISHLHRFPHPPAAAAGTWALCRLRLP